MIVKSENRFMVIRRPTQQVAVDAVLVLETNISNMFMLTNISDILC